MVENSGRVQLHPPSPTPLTLPPHLPLALMPSGSGEGRGVDSLPVPLRRCSGWGDGSEGAAWGGREVP